jgi:hypothetical protein
MCNKDYVETCKIKDYDELIDIIRGKSSFQDLRENYIFRGMKRESFDLTPSSLRNDKSTKMPIINDFIENSNFHHGNNKSLIDADKFTPDDQLAQSELHLDKEVHVLFEFFKKADESGLKLPIIPSFRENLNRKSDKALKYWEKYYLDNPNFYEVISLAQHHGVPTRALDWTYDYRVALYFATVGLLDEKEKHNENCVLWALNYKIFENNYLGDKFPDRHAWFPLIFYRPEYNKNPNLNAQKGLFLIWKFFFNEKGDRLKNIDKRGLDDILSEYLNKHRTHLNDVKYKNTKNYLKKNNVEYNYELPGIKQFIIENNQKIFYKFIIPKEIRHSILDELYKEGYSEEYLFPGYEGVSLSIKNKSKLNKFL